MKDAEVTMIMHFAELLTKESLPPKVRELQFTAMRELQTQLHYYAQRGYHRRLISEIAEKKGVLILNTTTKADMDKVMHPKPPHYNGAEFFSRRVQYPRRRTDLLERNVPPSAAQQRRPKKVHELVQRDLPR